MSKPIPASTRDQLYRVASDAMRQHNQRVRDAIITAGANNGFTEQDLIEGGILEPRPVAAPLRPGDPKGSHRNG